ncbi:SDR family NAD(P)-dependent oxidoreductase [Lysobacter korlensis]|uniref:SDR family NAD(P)-dependent oxidoreductase n=1 Tax=Lysobacter korlensis TaxID=553636 RepID=A0ABV6RP75_9GAMM
MPEPERRALVTGGAGGIGAAIAAVLAESGLVVTVADIRIDAARQVADRIGGFAIRLDLGNPDSVARAAAEAAGLSPTLDVLVNAAGIVDTTPTGVLDPATYRRVVDVNLNGMVEFTLALLPLLRRSGTARILNVGSVQGFRGAPDSLAYAISKGGVHNFTRALAADLAPHGVLVNALAPGFIDTPMAVLEDGSTEYETDWFQDVYVRHGRIPLRRPGRAEEVAAAARFFVSPENTYVTGQILAVDGGMVATF